MCVHEHTSTCWRRASRQSWECTSAGGKKAEEGDRAVERGLRSNQQPVWGGRETVDPEDKTLPRNFLSRKKKNGTVATGRNEVKTGFVWLLNKRNNSMFFFFYDSVSGPMEKRNR